MSLVIDEIFIYKIDKNNGEASLKLSDDGGEDIQIKKIQINTLDSKAPISVLKSQGTTIVSGSLFDFYLEVILDKWDDLEEQESGLFRITKDKIIKEG